MKYKLKQVVLSNEFYISILFSITNFVQNIVNSFDFTQTNNGAIMMTFDDGCESVYRNAFPIMKSMGIVGNVAVITDKIGCEGYLNLNQLLELQDEGWSIVSHTKSHPNISQLDKEDLINELEESKNKLKNLGFKGFNAFVVPFHYFDNKSMIYVRRLYSLSRNSSNKGMRLLGRFGVYKLLDYPLINKHNLPSLPIEDFYDVEAGLNKIKKFIDFSISHQKYGAMYTHGLSDDNIVAFRRITEFMSKHKKNVININDLL